MTPELLKKLIELEYLAVEHRVAADLDTDDDEAVIAAAWKVHRELKKSSQ